MNRLSSLLYMTYFDFAVQYRKTMIGPLWVLLGPTLFILTLGLLFSEVGNIPTSIFIPHLAIGLICWTLISGFVIGSTTVFQRNRAQIMQGGMSLVDIVVVEVLKTCVQFLHQLLILVVIFLYYDLQITWWSLTSLLGLIIVVLTGLWLTLLFGIIGARYRDLAEVVAAIMRIAFLATPIIWMPGEGGRGGVLGAFLTFNPFYHYLELIRAPLMGNEISPASWAVTGGMTLIGFLVTWLFYRKLYFRVALWV
jgi:ABC-2 type transport system permease protein/lipopolysaccharide transport system permease protein